MGLTRWLVKGRMVDSSLLEYFPSERTFYAHQDVLADVARPEGRFFVRSARTGALKEFRFIWCKRKNQIVEHLDFRSRDGYHLRIWC